MAKHTPDSESGAKKRRGISKGLLIILAILFLVAASIGAWTFFASERISESTQDIDCSDDVTLHITVDPLAADQMSTAIDQFNDSHSSVQDTCITAQMNLLPTDHALSSFNDSDDPLGALWVPADSSALATSTIARVNDNWIALDSGQLGVLALADSADAAQSMDFTPLATPGAESSGISMVAMQRLSDQGHEESATEALDIGAQRSLNDLLTELNGPTDDAEDESFAIITTQNLANQALTDLSIDPARISFVPWAEQSLTPSLVLFSSSSRVEELQARAGQVFYDYLLEHGYSESSIG